MHVAYLLSCSFTDYYHPEENGYDHDTPALFYLSLAIGCAMGLSVAQLTEAQRIAGMLGLDIDQAAKGEVTDWKHCTYASCAMRALHAVKMAYAGFQGPRDIYEGEAGINRFLPHSGSILDPPPDLESIVFKRWPALVFCQTPIDAAVEIAGRIDDPEAIERVLVHTYRKAIEEADGETAYRPVSRAGRTHSLPYCVAAALVKKTIEYEYFNDDFLEKEKAVARLIPKIAVAEDVHMTRTYPDGSPCRIAVTMKNGEAIRLGRDFPRGDPHNPLTDREIEEKVERSMSHLAGRDEVRSIIGRVWELEREDSVDWLVAPLKKRILKTDGREDS
jgi:2-methylcitrate dehydratase